MSASIFIEITSLMVVFFKSEAPSYNKNAPQGTRIGEKPGSRTV